MSTVRTRPQPARGVIAAQGRHTYEVAALVGLHPNTLGAILNRHRPPPPGLAERLAAVLEVDVAELFDDADEVVS